MVLHVIKWYRMLQDGFELDLTSTKMVLHSKILFIVRVFWTIRDPVYLNRSGSWKMHF